MRNLSSRGEDVIVGLLTEEARRTNIFGPILLLSLFSSVTNYLPVSVAASTIGLALWPFGLTLGWRVSKPIFALAVMFGFFFLYVVIYNAELFTQISFYRRDGNVFVTLVPLLFFACLAIPLDVEYILKRFAYFATALNLVVFLFWAVFGVAVLREYGTDLDSGTQHYYFLFVAHNAAGGFIGILASLTLALYLYNRSRLHLAMVAINVITLGATFSRGSIGGFIGAVLLIYIFSVGKRWPIWVLSAMLAVNLLLVGYVYYHTDIQTVLYRQLLVTEAIGNLHPAFQPLLDGNMATRIEVLWPMALHAFFQSPILGIGFSGFNDVQWELWGWPGVIAFNGSQKVVNTDATAHNTYLQLLAETGIVGLGLFFWFVKRLFDYLKNCEPGMVTDAIYLAFWMALISAFSEHRFFSPSQMLPFILILAMTMANNNYREKIAQHMANVRVMSARAALRQT